MMSQGETYPSPPLPTVRRWLLQLVIELKEFSLSTKSRVARVTPKRNKLRPITLISLRSSANSFIEFIIKIWQ